MLSVVAQQLLESFLSVIDEVTAQIKALEKVIEETTASLEATQLMVTIHGVSFYSSLLITAELGKIDWFDEANDVVRYAGSDPVVRDSGDPRTE